MHFLSSRNPSNLFLRARARLIRWVAVWFGGNRCQVSPFVGLVALVGLVGWLVGLVGIDVKSQPKAGIGKRPEQSLNEDLLVRSPGLVLVCSPTSLGLRGMWIVDGQ